MRNEKGQFVKGMTNPNKGKTLPWNDKAIEGRRKSGMYNDLSHLEKFSFKKGHIPTNKGIPMGEEAKLKMSTKLKGREVWNTGIGIGTPLGHKIRRCDKYVEWRNAVFKRDNYECVQCRDLLKDSPNKLNADHIKPFALICKENKIDSFEKALKCKKLWDIKNGRTLCIKHHKETDTYAGKYKHQILGKFPRAVI